jgi:hypothetical protein
MAFTLHGILGKALRLVHFPGINDQGFDEATPPSPSELLWNQMIEAGGCVDCRTMPKGLNEGPSGGMCTNVFCCHCGQGYNITPIAGWAERIHKDMKYANVPKQIVGG